MPRDAIAFNPARPPVGTVDRLVVRTDCRDAIQETLSRSPLLDRLVVWECVCGDAIALSVFSGRPWRECNVSVKSFAVELSICLEISAIATTFIWNFSHSNKVF